ncbi:MAG: SBBP repeat-containing protein [Candidatus Latescibacteria bacterium]|nr:SBBP repeat-containing protein [Candidatus Latescibacterota bacterium]
MITIFLSLIPNIIQAQVNPAWVTRYDGPNNNEDRATAITLDNTGNVYVTGYSYNTASNSEYATIKYDANGTPQWAARYNGPGNSVDKAEAIAVDNLGNVYVTGSSRRTTTVYTEDYATIKYNSAGQEQWVARYNAPANTYNFARAIAVDGLSNVFVTGYSAADYATIKYNSLGQVQWTARYNGTGNSMDEANALVIDNSGNVYVTGASIGINSSYDYATIKYNSDGVEQWVARYNGPANTGDAAYAITLDNNGNVYVTGTSIGSGTSNDYTTIKYNSSGQEQWVARYNGPGNSMDYATDIAVDSLGNVYITGYSAGSGTNFDYATIKYNSSGQEQWVTRYNGPGNHADYAVALALDDSANVYVTGYSRSTSASDSEDYTTIKYNTDGIEQWVIRYNGPDNNIDRASAIVVDNSYNIFVTGASRGVGSSYDYATIKYVQTETGVQEINNIQQKTAKIEIYPNPARTYLNINLPYAAEYIKIFDITGKTVKELRSSGRNDLRVSLEGIKNGIYFIQVDSEIVQEKLVITK